jgi:hypothetical protein
MFVAQNALITIGRLTVPSCPSTSVRPHGVCILVKNQIFIIWTPWCRLRAFTHILHRKTVTRVALGVFDIAARFEGCADAVRTSGATSGDGADMAEEAREEGFESGEAGCEDADVHFKLLPV